MIKILMKNWYAGAKVIKKIYEEKNKTINILTHCNAGWLATVDWGTATSPIYNARRFRCANSRMG